MALDRKKRRSARRRAKNMGKRIAVICGLPGSGNSWIRNTLDGWEGVSAVVHHGDQGLSKTLQVFQRWEGADVRAIIPVRHPLCQWSSMLRRFPNLVQQRKCRTMAEYLEKCRKSIDEGLRQLGIPGMVVRYESVVSMMAASFRDMAGFLGVPRGALPVEAVDANAKYLVDPGTTVAVLRDLLVEARLPLSVDDVVLLPTAFEYTSPREAQIIPTLDRPEDQTEPEDE